VNIPEADAAQTSRFVVCELKKPAEGQEREKIERSAESRRVLLGRDSERFRRRTFRALPQVLADIEFLRENLGDLLKDQRRADLYAPLLAAAWAVQSAEPVGCEAGMRWQTGILDDIFRGAETDAAEDEDRMIEQLLAGMVRTDDAKMRTVAELLAASAWPDGSGDAFRDHLSRLGIALRTVDGVEVIAIARSSDSVRRLLADTPYQVDYDAPLRRNALCLNPDEPRQMTMAIGRPRCRLLEWAGFRKRYMGGAE